MSGNKEEAKKLQLYIIRRHLRTCGYGPGGSPLSSSPSKVISSFLMSVDHVDNVRWRHRGERNNSKDNTEGLAGPMDGLIQRQLLIQEARIIRPHVRNDIVLHLYADNSSFREPVLIEEMEDAARVLLRW